ncbi:MAG: chemotaxis protein CheW [Syntrophomonadaceae bacterium]
MEKRQVVIFKCRNEEFALDINTVKEIIAPPLITRVPRSAVYIKGVINLRGIIVPIISLSIRLGHDEQDFSEDTRIIIVNINDVLAGIIVDRVEEVVYLNRDEIETPELTDSIETKFVQGIGRLNDRLLIMLDIAEILNLEGEPILLN